MSPAPDGYAFRPFTIDDAPALAAAYARNREHLAPWDPVRPDAFFTVEGQRKEAEQRLELQERGLFSLYVIEGPGGDLVGRLTIQNIVRGTMFGGTLGYWVDKDHTGRGLATAGVAFLEAEAERFGLHRLDAATMVENVASRRVLEARRFARYGLAPKFLFLNGAWRDHVMYQKLLHDRPLV
jgi:ribosomal-protein-alanine N-acetyltransferase